MRSIVTRLERLEQARIPAVLGRFICLRGAEVPQAVVDDFLKAQGVTLRPRDLVLQDTPADPGSSGTVGADEPLSLVEIIPLTRPFEDLLAELD